MIEECFSGELLRFRPKIDVSSMEAISSMMKNGTLYLFLYLLYYDFIFIRAG